jgi:hypothetical protein
VRDGGESGTYRTVLALLAIATGSPGIASQLFGLIRTSESGAAVTAILEMEAPKEPEFSRDGSAFVVLRTLAADAVTADALRAWLPRVSRFTFEFGADQSWRR